MTEQQQTEQVQFPNSEKTEKTVLCAMSLYPEFVLELCAENNGSLFYNGTTRIIYEAMHKTHKAGRNVDLMAVYERLTNDNYNKQADAFISWTGDVPSRETIPTAIARLRELLMHRELILRSRRIAGKSFHTGGDVFQLLAESIEELQSIYDDILHGYKSEYKVADAGKELLKYGEQIRAKDGNNVGAIPSGFTDLDLVLGGGFSRHELVVIAGRTSMGKSAFAKSMAINMATAGLPVLYVGVEDDKLSIARRGVNHFANSNVTSDKMLANWNKDTQTKFHLALSELEKIPYYSLDATKSNLNQIEQQLRRALYKGQYSAVFVDYIQRIRVGSREPEYKQISQVMDVLDAINKEYRVPIFVVSQNNRGSESSRDNVDLRKTQPKLNDLKGSGTIEEKADTVLAVWRPEYYDKRALFDFPIMLHGLNGQFEFEQRSCRVPNLTMCMMLKRRDGELENVTMLFDKQATRFMDFDEIEYYTRLNAAPGTVSHAVTTTQTDSGVVF